MHFFLKQKLKDNYLIYILSLYEESQMYHDALQIYERLSIVPVDVWWVFFLNLGGGAKGREGWKVGCFVELWFDRLM